MRKVITIMLVLSMLLNNISYAFVTRNIEVTEEKKIPVYITSDKQEVIDYIDISELRNVEIIDSYIDTGEIYGEVKDDEIKVELCDGKYSVSPRIVTKTKNIQIESKTEEAEEKIIIIEPEFEVKEIVETDGDFQDAYLNNKGQIVINVKEDAVGTQGFDEKTVVTSIAEISVGNDNRERTIESEYYYPIAEPKSIKIDSVTLGGTAKAQITDGKIKILFSNGTPVLNETSKNAGYGYFWIDRNTNGEFITKINEEIYPNSIYRADNYYFTGNGTFLDKQLETIEVKKEDGWTDYAGVNVGGIRYLYLEEDSGGIPNAADNTILKQNTKIFEGQWFNTEKFKVEFMKDKITFSPSGKLYSMGKLIKGTDDWGEEYPNLPEESTAQFINPITGKKETYVKHFKFFYGPKDKTIFGGYFTYPYKCNVSYSHYKPATIYSGNLSYTYEDYENEAGYTYNGWIKIRYTADKEIRDYPPSPPYGIRYDEQRKMIIWKPAKDDYTLPERLKYQIQAKAGDTWEDIGRPTGLLEYGYEENTEIRIRAEDEVEQFSEWAYSNQSAISIEAEVTPQIIEKGEEINIKAITKSMSDITAVEAKCDELFEKQNLLRIKEEVPVFYEIGFNLLCNYAKESFIVSNDELFANNDNSDREVSIRSFFSEALTQDKTLTISLPIIPFRREGTIIMPNQNYLNTPINFARISDKWWHIESGINLKIKNKETGRIEDLISFYNGIKQRREGNLVRYDVNPYLRINKLVKDVSGNYQYVEIPLDTESAGDPVTLTWENDDETAYFKVYSGEKLVYNYESSAEEVAKIQEISQYSITKKMKRYRNTTSGFAPVSGKDEIYEWPDAASLFKSINWLGYEIKSNFYDDEVLEEYNNLPSTRAVNRMLVMDDTASKNVISKYLKSIRETDMCIDRSDKDSVLAKEVLEKTCEFSAEKIPTNSETELGIHFIEVTATNEEGDYATVRIPIIVVDKNEDKETDEYPEEEGKIERILFGRFFYENESTMLEEMSKTDSTIKSEGFICAGETIAFKIEAQDTKYIEIDINGDESVTFYDGLTERFLSEEVMRRGRTAEAGENYDFPTRIYPAITDETGESTFIYLYTVPYATKQTLESWSSLRLKTGSFEIDELKLFERIINPYEMVIYLNGEEEGKQKILFDVFERWDTVLNRDATRYINNYETKWKVEF